MVYSNISDLISSYKEKDHLVDIVYDIISLVKKKDFASAYKSLKMNNISFSDLICRTQRLKVKDLVKFADYVINHSKHE